MRVRTVGVEEEFLLFDTDADRLADVGPEVADAAERAGDDAGQFEKELKQAQTEHASSPTTSLAELAAELTDQRRRLVEGARAHGARLVASGTSPVGDDSATTDDPRYHHMERRFAALQRSELTCAMHIHVSVESDDEAVAVLNRVAPWLSVLAALTANSPFHGGRETGYASYRRIVWNQWPTAGPTNAFADPAGYRALVQDLIDTGAARDEGMIYFDARLSADYPTVELRVCDVCIEVGTAVAVAGLSRALVETAAAEDRTLELPTELLRAASWRAARFGMTRDLVDLTRAAGAAPLAPAWDLVDALVAYVRPALDAAGDTDDVRRALKQVRTDGTGAERQRAAAEGDGPAGAIAAATIRA
jgi:glutamate---cysteine ligase / carboxylate-amine ligase